ncbi:MAG: hypothetical protein JJE52_05755 [Acidimicrobiia bacterium]|nr:hypothetical protein [Acidimicrobiia bacterium]
MRAGVSVIDVGHPLQRAAVLFDLAPGRAAELHLRAAEIADDPAQRMLHHLAATLGHDPDLGRRAVAFADERLADGWELSAIELLTRAAGILDEPLERADALLRAADASLGIGDEASARELLGRVGPPTGASLDTFVRGQLAFVEGRAVEARRLLEQVWEEEPDSPIGVRAAGLVATVAANHADAELSLIWSRRALAAGGSTSPDLGHAVSMLASAWALRGEIEAGLAEVSQWVARVRGQRAEADARLAQGTNTARSMSASTRSGRISPGVIWVPLDSSQMRPVRVGWSTCTVTSGIGLRAPWGMAAERRAISINAS